MGRRLPPVAVAGVAGVAVALGIAVAVLGRPAGPGRPAQGLDSADSRTAEVKVSRQNISAVLTVDAVLQATPHFTVAAPADGPVRHRADLRPGAAVQAGEHLALQRSAQVDSPVAGTFVRWLVADGASVNAGVPVAEVMYGGFGAAAAMPPAAAYRLFSGHLSARAEIINGPGPFDCPVLLSPETPPLPDPNGVESGNPGVGPAFVCAVPPNIRAIQGLRALVGLRTAERRGVAVLPVSAVAGSTGVGEVWLVRSDGTVVIRKVDLGVTDGSVVEIIGGLALGDKVRATPPDLLH